MRFADISHKPAHSPKVRSRLVAGAMAAVALAGMAAIPASAESLEDDATWQSVDGGSLGVVPNEAPNVWCLADAGSLGIPNPPEVCS